MTDFLSVSALNIQIKSILEATFLNIVVEGEISRPTYHTSGHLYFTLKDEESSISCVMFKGNNQKLKFKIEDGQKVIIYGGMSVFVPRGGYQINCSSIEPSGAGALTIAYEQLKNKLTQKGYFELSIKKSLPKFPKRVALVTSKTGAALQDMLRVSQKRWPLLEFTLFDTLVQGSDAAKMVAKNIAIADTLGFDAIIIGRGGGSVEDLWAFNEEIVADAVFEAKTPIISAVGHEIDYVISDFVADVRASTPSNAIEILLPDKNEILMTIDSVSEGYLYAIKNVLYKKNQLLLSLGQMFEKSSIPSRISMMQKEIEFLAQKFNATIGSKIVTLEFELTKINQYFLQNMKNNIFIKEKMVESLNESYKNNNPALNFKESYGQIAKNGQKTDPFKLKKGDNFEVWHPKVILNATVLEVLKIK